MAGEHEIITQSAGQDKHFVLGKREIRNGDSIELLWPDGQQHLAVVQVVQRHGQRPTDAILDELRIVGIIHGAKCLIVLDYAIRKQGIKARWPETVK